ncbi:uncharacterized protein (UPF0128 family) [Cytobacillus eiseniae]|uniref:Uncharacterized protein (UPF0128 family) n=1 Tax=Cytobacillus eiseniae TaxID=762947 RepID=A0ABS4RGJ3_9BACI|nr:hypothetical protein [Cytobacillus eiseniae]MBP2242001.1 uncharacterized protein (UPF0128 family) [Cytobacillus eiseniae]
MNSLNVDCINKEKNIILTKYDYHKNLLKNEIKTIKSIKIPTQDYSIKNIELVDWIIEEFTPKELESLLEEIKIVKKRTQNIKPFLSIIAVGLLHKV